MPVIVNRAPVLTLWAAVVAERLGHPADTALTLRAQTEAQLATVRNPVQPDEIRRAVAQGVAEWGRDAVRQRE